jgi:manganese oxidase
MIFYKHDILSSKLLTHVFRPTMLNQSLILFGIGISGLLIIFNLLNYNNNQVFSQTANTIKNITNGIRDRIGYTANVLQYDKMKNCNSNLSERPNATQYLTYFNCGHVTINYKNNTTTRKFTLIVEENHTIPISTMGHELHAWTFNGTVPGPTMRMTEGDVVKITIINSPNSKHSHSLHMHSLQPGAGDIIAPGKNITYTFTIKPYGLYPYHDHVSPIEDHINRGMYGMFIVDPKQPRMQMHEMAMLMNGYDMNYTHEGGSFASPVLDKQDPTKLANNGLPDRHNDIYTVNSMAFVYRDHPIHLIQGQWYRIYLTNMLDFDLIDSFNLNGMMFNYIPEGTSTIPSFKSDIVTQTVGDRGIIEFKAGFPGVYMFDAPQPKFNEEGWMGYFYVTTTATAKNNHS